MVYIQLLLVRHHWALVNGVEQLAERGLGSKLLLLNPLVLLHRSVRRLLAQVSDIVTEECVTFVIVDYVTFVKIGLFRKWLYFFWRDNRVTL